MSPSPVSGTAADTTQRKRQFVIRIGFSSTSVVLIGGIEVHGRCAVVFSHRGVDSSENQCVRIKLFSAIFILMKKSRCILILEIIIS